MISEKHPASAAKPRSQASSDKSESIVRASYGRVGSRTSVERVYEAGSLRLRHPKGSICEAVLVNTSGGIVAGDRLNVEIAVGPGAAVVLSTAAAEKIYRSERQLSLVTTRLKLAPASRASWIPQETIIFGGARLRRRFDVDLAEDAVFAASEILVFGRRAFGEHDISGSLHDSWRVRRAGRLVFADETRIEGQIGAALARAAVAQGACAMALILLARPEASGRLDAVRATIDALCRTAPIEGGATLKDGIIVARLVAHSSELLRRVVADVLGTAGAACVPRVWQ